MQCAVLALIVFHPPLDEKTLAAFRQRQGTTSRIPERKFLSTCGWSHRRKAGSWRATSAHGQAMGEFMRSAKRDRITTTIEREWLAQIIAGTKKIEYRQIKPYWTKRFAKVSVPFELRLLNGMNPPVPEVTVLIHRITKDRRAGEYRLHIKRVLNYKHWDKRRQRPKR
jgi:hypothetical protein